MADNVTLNSGSGGAVAAADDIGSVFYQRVKLSVGADGTAVDAIPVSAALDTTATGVQAVGLVAQFDDTTPAAVTENQFAPVRLSTERSLHVEVRDAAGNERGMVVDASGFPTVNVNGTVTVGSHAVTNAGTFAVQDAAAEASLSVLDDWDNAASDGASVSGDTAHDAVDAGEPVKIGGYASAAAPTGVSGDADRVNAWFLRNGAQAAVITAAGALIGGDATNGLDVDVTRVTGTVTVDGSGVTQPVSLASVPSHAVTNAGTFAVQESGAALTALQLIDDTVFAEDVAAQAADKGVAVLAVRRDADTSLVGTDNDYANLQVDANGYLKVEIFDGGGSHTVDGTVTANLAAGTNNIGDVDILTIAAGDNNIGNVDIVSLPASTNTLEVVGDAAHDAAIAGNPVRLAGRALTADYTAVAAGDTADIITTLTGKVVVYPYANPNQQWTYAAASGGITTQTAVTVNAAAGAGIRNYVTSAQIINGHATVSTEVLIVDGAAGTVLWRGWAQAAGGGISVKFDPPLRGTANTLIEVDNVTTGSAVYYNLQGFTAAE